MKAGKTLCLLLGNGVSIFTSSPFMEATGMFGALGLDVSGSLTGVMSV